MVKATTMSNCYIIQGRRPSESVVTPLALCLLRKEVIQPQVPLRLPCYDFIPITTHSLGTRFLTVSWYDFGNKGLS